MPGRIPQSYLDDGYVIYTVYPQHHDEYWRKKKLMTVQRDLFYFLALLKEQTPDAFESKVYWPYGASLKDLRLKIILWGMSLGGLNALLAATTSQTINGKRYKGSELLDGVVAIAPWIYVDDEKFSVTAGARGRAKKIEGRGWMNDLFDCQSYTATHIDFSKLNIPVFISHSMNDNNVDSKSTIIAIDKCIEAGTYKFLSIQMHNNRGNKHKCRKMDSSHCHNIEVETNRAKEFITLVVSQAAVPPVLLQAHKHELKRISAIAKLRIHYQHPNYHMNYPHTFWFVHRLLNDFKDRVLNEREYYYFNRAKMYMSLVMEANEDVDAEEDPCLWHIMQSLTGKEQIKIYNKHLSARKFDDDRTEMDTYYESCKAYLLSEELFGRDITRMRTYLTADELYSIPPILIDGAENSERT